MEYLESSHKWLNKKPTNNVINNNSLSLSFSLRELCQNSVNEWTNELKQ